MSTEGRLLLSARTLFVETMPKMSDPVNVNRMAFIFYFLIDDKQILELGSFLDSQQQGQERKTC
jgi:hypothetical protein